MFLELVVVAECALAVIAGYLLLIVEMFVKISAFLENRQTVWTTVYLFMFLQIHDLDFLRPQT